MGGGKSLSYLLAAFVVLAGTGVAFGKTFSVRAGSYNIRCETTNDTGDMTWNSRKGSLVSLVKKMNCDVIGFQEVKDSQKTYLADKLTGYTFYAGKESGSSEYMDIAYKTDRFDRLGGGTFWLSSTPDKQSKFSESEYYRICTWVLLCDKTTSGKLLFASTHLDLVKEVRLKQMKVVLNFVAKYLADKINVVVVGDMNENENDAAVMEAAKVFVDSAIEAKSVSGPWRTFNNWTYVAPGSEPTAEYALTLPVSNRNPVKSGGNNHKRIDFIFASELTAVDSYVVRNDTQTSKEVYPSDHYPIYSDLVLPIRRLTQEGRIKVEISADCPYVSGGRRFVLTNGAYLEDATNIDFVLPAWVLRAAVEDGEIVIYTRPKPLWMRIK